nr:MAG TPA: hypothetical protein [Caudoviricetes sp.]
MKKEVMTLDWEIVKSEQEEKEHYSLKQWQAVEANEKRGYDTRLGNR